jgi:hypothetical protein
MFRISRRKIGFDAETVDRPRELLRQEELGLYRSDGIREEPFLRPRVETLGCWDKESRWSGCDRARSRQRADARTRIRLFLTRGESLMRQPKRENQVYLSNVAIGIFVGMSVLALLVTDFRTATKFVLALALIIVGLVLARLQQTNNEHMAM